MRQQLQRAWYFGAWWLYCLLPLEWFFRSCVALRRWLYRRNVLSSYRAQVPVVVVGNISVGGTGKTPVVIALVTELAARGLTAGVVSRGYGAQHFNFPYRVDESSNVSNCGDEALMTYERTGAVCVVAPARSDAVRFVESCAAVDVIISDDGLQHYAMARDLEIIMVDAATRFGNGRCLPAGPLREPLSRLREADFVLQRGGERSEAGVSLRPLGMVNVATGEERAINTAPLSTEVYAVAALGQPRLFFRTLAELGFQADERMFPDHHPYCAEDFSAMHDKPILMTEKDAVKCRELVGDNAWFLKVEAVVPKLVIETVVELASQHRANKQNQLFPQNQ